MGVIYLYIDEDDAKDVLKLLNEDLDLAFLIKGKELEWKAVQTIQTLYSCRIWHIPSGPLSVPYGKNEPDVLIENPFDSWHQKPMETIRPLPKDYPYPRIKPNTNFFDLSIYLPKDDIVGLSTIQWVGDYNSVLGIKADESTKKHWLKLKRLFKKMMQKEIPRVTNSKSKLKAYCFPGAYQHIMDGGLRSSNPGYWKPN